MTLENSSTTQFTFSKKQGQTELAVQINNMSQDMNSLWLDVQDAETGTKLPTQLNGFPVSDVISIPAQSIRTLLVDLNDAGSRIIVELSRGSSGGGISLRQKNTSIAGKVTNLIELIIK